MTTVPAKPAKAGLACGMRVMIGTMIVSEFASGGVLTVSTT